MTIISPLAFRTHVVSVSALAFIVPGPRGVEPDYTVLEKIAAPLSQEKPASLTIDLVWERMAPKILQFDDSFRWRSLPDDGVALNASAFLDLDFVETKNLKYDPAAFKEAHAAPA